MRTTDRQHVSEAIRTQSRKLWHTRGITSFKGQVCFEVTTEYDERLVLWFDRSGQLVKATYTHWDHYTGEIVCREEITLQKRARVLHLIGACNRTHAKSAAL